MGDSSDNIPGVAGVGPKTATGLLLQYGTLDGIYAHLPEIKENLRKKLETDRDKAYLSYDLATIRCNAPVEFTPEANLVQEPDGGALYALFMKLEFVKLIDRYHLRPELNRAEEKTEYVQGECSSEAPETEVRARELLQELAAQPYVSVLVDEGLTGVVADIPDAGRMVYFSREALGAAYDAVLAELFSAKIRKASHDVKSLMRRLLDAGLPAEGFVFDTALAAYLIDPTQGHYELERLTVFYLNFEPSKPNPEEAGETAARLGALFSRTASVSALVEPMQEKLRSMGLDALFTDVELPLCAVLARMEHEGVEVDQLALLCIQLDGIIYTSGRCLPSGSSRRRRRSTATRARNSTSIPPKCWVRSFLTASDCRLSRKLRAAIRRTPTYWRSCAQSTPSCSACWITGC